MVIKSCLRKYINWTQIKALLWKDILVKRRQPWLTAVQFIWPLIIFLTVYLLRLKFGAYDVDECQFPSRELPSKTTLLPFFQSYICTIENACSSTQNYSEISDFETAPITPVVNIVQTFLNEDKLYNAVIDLPTSANFLGTITSIATHPMFDVLEKNVVRIMEMVGLNGSPIDNTFDVTQLWSDDMIFSKSGYLFCGKPFPRSHNIRLVDRVFYAHDYNGANKDELDVMPTPYCKQLYLDVTNTNNGKITWNYIKPIIQGKFLYGPINERTNHFVRNANDTLQTMNRLKIFLKSIDSVITSLRVEGEFQNKFLNLVKLAQSPFAQMLLANFNVDKKILDTVFDALLYDKQVKEIVATVANIFECFSVDRFVGVDSEEEMEDLAVALNDQKLYYAGVYFENNGQSKHDEYSYKIRMDADNTPVTLENRNRFWFPGPNGNFNLNMRYHRGFIQIQHMIDQAIIKSAIDRENVRLEEEWKRTTTTPEPPTTTTEVDEFPNFDSDDDNDTDQTTSETTDSTETTTMTGNNDESVSFSSSTKTESSIVQQSNEIDFDEGQNETSVTNFPETVIRKKRQFDFFGNLLGGSSSKDDKTPKFKGIEISNMNAYTKQFPYPKYRKDDFLTGLYLAQCIQMIFFFALIVQVTNAVRNRIWMKESGNSTLMRIMGLERSSENIAWILSTFIDFAITFLICEIVLFTGKTLQTTSRGLLYAFLLIFGACVISFCYMMSTFFESASNGSVSTVIFFLITYMPYIIIISLGSVLSMTSKFFASLSFATAFCYAWRYIMRLELQQRPFTFTNAFDGTFETNEFKFGIVMICIDLILYVVIGYFYERYTNEKEFKFHKIEKKDMDPSIGAALQNCTKKYVGSTSTALDKVSIVFRKDLITCLLGRNGAGKSTIIKLLTGQIAPTSGHVYWPQNWDRISAHKREGKVGLCPQNNILIPNLTAREHLELYVCIKTNGNGNRREVDRVMQSLQFAKHENYYSQNLSGGFKRRLNVAISFICSPNLVILDEPCSGVDMKARKNIWDLVSDLRQGRAVVLATHYLDEAEHLSDSILIMKEGHIVAEYDPDSLKEQFTQTFDLHVNFGSVDNTKAIESIKMLLQEFVSTSSIKSISAESLVATINYRSDASSMANYTTLLKAIEGMVDNQAIESFRVVSSNLEQVFNELVAPSKVEKPATNGSVHFASDTKMIDEIHPIVQEEHLSEFEVMKILLKKRFIHFKRNFRLILCVLILPAIFEIIAMGFMQLRPPGEHDVNLKFSRKLYSNSTEVYSSENGQMSTAGIHNAFQWQCNANAIDQFGNKCKRFNSSEEIFRWVLNTTDKYPENRYGGISLNGSRSAIWYNNNGYHSMPVFLNELNTAHFRSVMNNSQLKITTYNHPLKLDAHELSQSSILQQVADAGISLILLVAFSLVVAGSSVYIVNERLNGEKLQQKLCDVSFKTYWGVAFLWDIIIYLIALILAVIIFKIFDIPVYTAKDNLYGICMLLLLFGFAAIQMVHLCEKLFSDPSLANMYFLCLNIIIALLTVTTIMLFDVLGESDFSGKIRNFLNRLFLILPQHALADGLVQICQNHLVAEIFARYYINTYKSPIRSDLILRHYCALISIGCLFWSINYVVESGIWRSYLKSRRTKKIDTVLETVASVQHNGSSIKDIKKHSIFSRFGQSYGEVAMKADSICKTYDGTHEAVKDLTFTVKTGECFGLLGANGAGKSTVFSMLSGEMCPTSGTVNILNRGKGIAYCPQTNALDNLLTVEETMYYYAKLRRILNIAEVTEQALDAFNLTPYRKVLVKNLSGGNRRKLSVAVTCFGSSSNVLMDEPTSDMDPVTRAIVYRSINRLLLENRSVILTSHTITEIDRVCDRIGIMRQGKMIVTAPPNQLKIMYGNRYAITVYYDQIEALTIERDLKKLLTNIENLIVHKHCLQFRMKIRNTSKINTGDENGLINNNNNNNNNNNEMLPDPVIEDGMIFSELIEKLQTLIVDRGITYTVTECLLDQAFERVLDADENALHSYNNGAYEQSETPT